MWTVENRARYNRDRLRYPSGLTDEEWALFEPLIPPGRSGGGKRRANLREVVNGLMCVLSTGCQWRAIPKDLPPRATVHDYIVLWTCERTLDRIHHALYVACREQAGREASPTVSIIDSQDSTKGFEALTRRWVVERTFAWLGRCRRLAKDFERTIESAQAWVRIANIRMLARRIARA